MIVVTTTPATTPSSNSGWASRVLITVSTWVRSPWCVVAGAGATVYRLSVRGIVKVLAARIFHAVTGSGLGPVPRVRTRRRERLYRTRRGRYGQTCGHRFFGATLPVEPRALRPGGSIVATADRVRRAVLCSAAERGARERLVPLSAPVRPSQMHDGPA